MRLQIDLMLNTRDDLVRQKADIEAQTEQQSQDQNDIYQYLRGKLKDNYVAISELEAKVSLFETLASCLATFLVWFIRLTYPPFVVSNISLESHW